MSCVWSLHQSPVMSPKKDASPCVSQMVSPSRWFHWHRCWHHDVHRRVMEPGGFNVWIPQGTTDQCSVNVLITSGIIKLSFVAVIMTSCIPELESIIMCVTGYTMEQGLIKQCVTGGKKTKTIGVSYSVRCHSWHSRVWCSGYHFISELGSQ